MQANHLLAAAMTNPVNEENTRSLNVLQIISGLDVNGALEHCRLLSRELCRSGHNVTILSRRGSWLWKHVDEIPLQMVECDMNRWPLTDVWRMARWVSAQRFDVMHTHMSRAHMYGIMLSRLTGIPVVATAHCQHVQPYWYLNDFVIANSSSTLRFQRRVNRISKKKARTIHCFVDIERFTQVDDHWRKGIRNQWRVQPEQKVIGIIGDVVPYKGHKYLFQALPELVRRFPDLKLVVVGRFKRDEPFTRQLRRFQLEHHLTRRVKWIGRRDNIHQIMKALDVVVIPSLVESLGMVALEAMAAGRPVVAARTGGLKDVIRHEYNGLLVKRYDSAGLASAVSQILSVPELGEHLVRNGGQWVRENVAPAVLTHEIAGIYRNVCQESGNGQSKAA